MEFRFYGIFAYMEHFSRDKRVPCNRNRVCVKYELDLSTHARDKGGVKKQVDTQ